MTAALESQRILIQALLEAGQLRLVETHISWVLLAKQYAYKIKKAVNLGFLDFSALRARRFYCAEEIRINRRLAPSIYLGVVPIGGTFARPELGVEPAIEYAVKMRRFAAENELDRLQERGRLLPAHLEELAGTIAEFHRNLRPTSVEAYGAPETVYADARQNFAQLRTLLQDKSDLRALEKVERATVRAYRACAKQLAARKAQGFIRECHGDLHLGNIVLADGKVTPFDAIEFNPELRTIDVMNEAAFLVMDLFHKNAAALAWRFLNAYLESTGDYEGLSVLRFYLAYRAMVRAKIGAIRAAQSADAREWAACRNHITLALSCLAKFRPALIITHGLPASGKSRFAREAAVLLGAVRIRSDVERKRLFGLSALESSPAHADIYSAAATCRTYSRLLALARVMLKAGFNVVVDAAFLKQGEREAFYKLAAALDVPFVIASIEADDATLKSRITKRQHDASEADLGVLNLLQANHEPLSPQERGHAVVFDATSEDKFSGTAWGRLLKLAEQAPILLK